MRKSPLPNNHAAECLVPSVLHIIFPYITVLAYLISTRPFAAVHLQGLQTSPLCLPWSPFSKPLAL